MVGQTALENGKAAFVDAFVQRAAFRTAYDGLSNAAYVDALIANTGVSFTSAERNASGKRTRRRHDAGCRRSEQSWRTQTSWRRSATARL